MREHLSTKTQKHTQARDHKGRRKQVPHTKKHRERQKKKQKRQRQITKKNKDRQRERERQEQFPTRAYLETLAIPAYNE